MFKLHACGIGESDAATTLGDVLDRGREPLVGITASKGVVTLRIRSSRPRTDAPTTARTPSDPLEQTVQACRDRLGAFVFGEGEDTLASRVAALLRGRGETVAVAESCTGGMLGAMLTDAPGASDVFPGGWIAYANTFKHAQLGVHENDLRTFGAVSREVVHAMATNALAHAGADHALAISGVAGPGGGSDTKPVGTVWIAHAWARPAEPAQPRVDARCFRIAGDRADVRERASLTALNMLRLRLQTGAVPGPLLWQVEPRRPGA